MRGRGLAIVAFALCGISIAPRVEAQRDASVASDATVSPDATVSSDAAIASDAAVAPDAGAPPPLRAEGGHILLESAGEVIRVTEVYLLAIDEPIPAPARETGEIDGGGDAAGDPWIVLPDGAEQVEIERGEELWRPVDGGVGPSGAIEPGRYTLAFSFLLGASGGRAMVTHTLPFPVASLHVLWADGMGVTVRGMGFSDSGTIQMGQRGMRVLERPMLTEGQPLVLITSEGEAPASRGMSRPEPELRDPLGSLRSVTLVLAGLLLVAGMLLPFTTRWTGRR